MSIFSKLLVNELISKFAKKNSTLLTFLTVKYFTATNNIYGIDLHHSSIKRYQAEIGGDFQNQNLIHGHGKQ